MIEDDIDPRLLAKRISWHIRSRIREDFEEYPSVKLDLCYLAEKDHAKSKRVFAHTGHKKNTICVCKDFYDLPEDNMLGILWHEHGHIVAEIFEDEPESFDWDWLTDDDEVNADLVCYHLFGVPIHYDRRKIQVVTGMAATEHHSRNCE